MLNNHIIPGCPYVKELEWSVRHLVCSAWHIGHLVDTLCPQPIFGNYAPLCHVTGHTSPVEALTAFGYVKMEFFGLRFSAFYYGGSRFIYGNLP